MRRIFRRTFTVCQFLDANIRLFLLISKYLTYFTIMPGATVLFTQVFAPNILEIVTGELGCVMAVSENEIPVVCLRVVDTVPFPNFT